MDNDLSSAFAVLKSKLGNHGAAAAFLGLSRDHYCAIRNGRVPIPARTRDLILLKAQEVSAPTCGRGAHASVARDRELVNV